MQGMTPSGCLQVELPLCRALAQPLAAAWSKVPLAVCIRSVQAGRYPNALAAAQSIVDTAGVRSLFTVSRCPLCFRPRSRREAMHTVYIP